jgi:hypothetical protein
MRLIGEILVARGSCTPDRIEEALGDQIAYDGRLGTNLLEAGSITEEQLARALSAQHGLPALWGEIAVEARALATVAAPRARCWEAVPLRLERRCLDVLVSEVRDLARLDDMAFSIGKEIRPVVVPEVRLWQLLRRHYGIPCPARRARTGGSGALLASHQELLAELQAATGAVGRPPGPPAPSRSGAGVPFVSDAEILAELQDDASRRYLAPGLPLARAAAPRAPAATDRTSRH